MKIIISLVFVSFFLTGCGKNHHKSNEHLRSIHPSVMGAFDPKGPLPIEALNFQISVQFDGFSAEQESKVYRAMELIKRVVGTTEFRDRVLNKTYNGELSYFDNDGLTNLEIYKKILLAKEELSSGGFDNHMELKLKLYYENSTTVGHTSSGDKTIWVNQKFFDEFQDHDVADNLFHEWLHKLGFTHDTYYPSVRQHSVPYAVGDMVRQIARSGR